MEISRSTELMDFLGAKAGRNRTFRVLRPEDRSIVLRSEHLPPFGSPDQTEVPQFRREIGMAALVYHNDRLLGITGTRPVIGLRTRRSGLELSGYCFRDCQRLYIYGANGGLPLLMHSDPVTIGPHVKVKPRDISAGELVGHVISLNDTYCLTFSYDESRCGQIFGYLNTPISPDDSFGNEIKLFPIWKAKSPEELIRSMADHTLYLRGIFYTRHYEVFNIKLWRGVDGKVISFERA